MCRSNIVTAWQASIQLIMCRSNIVTAWQASIQLIMCRSNIVTAWQASIQLIMCRSNIVTAWQASIQLIMCRSNIVTAWQASIQLIMCRSNIVTAWQASCSCVSMSGMPVILVTSFWSVVLWHCLLKSISLINITGQRGCGEMAPWCIPGVCMFYTCTRTITKYFCCVTIVCNTVRLILNMKYTWLAFLL